MTDQELERVWHRVNDAGRAVLAVVARAAPRELTFAEIDEAANGQARSGLQSITLQTKRIERERAGVA